MKTIFLTMILLSANAFAGYAFNAQENKVIKTDGRSGEDVLDPIRHVPANIRFVYEYTKYVNEKEVESSASVHCDTALQVPFYSLGSFEYVEVSDVAFGSCVVALPKLNESITATYGSVMANYVGKIPMVEGSVSLKAVNFSYDYEDESGELDGGGAQTFATKNLSLENFFFMPNILNMYTSQCEANSLENSTDVCWREACSLCNI